MPSGYSFGPAHNGPKGDREATYQTVWKAVGRKPFVSLILGRGAKIRLNVQSVVERTWNEGEGERTQSVVKRGRESSGRRVRPSGRGARSSRGAR